MIRRFIAGARRVARRVRCLSMLGAALMLFAATEVTAQATTQVGVPGRINASVSVAAIGPYVALAWGASTSAGTDVFTAVSRDGGSTFASPVRVNDREFDARVGGEQPPRIVLLPRRGMEPAMVVVWGARRTEGSRLLYTRSDDGGRTFRPAAVVPGTDATGSRGWASVAADARGAVHVLWLDHRDVPPVAHAHGAQGHGPSAARDVADPVRQASFSRLMAATVADGSPTRPVTITTGVCYCCKTSFVAGTDGTLHGAWRHVFAGSLRDIAITSSRDGGRTYAAPVRVSEDQWSFDGCPDNGPALAVDGAQGVHVVWPTPADGRNPSTMSLLYSHAAGRAAFSPRVALPVSGPAGHVQVSATPEGGVLVAWDEMSSVGPVVRLVQRVNRLGGRIEFRSRMPAIAGRYPALAASGSATVMAWTQPAAGGSTIAVRRIER